MRKEVVYVPAQLYIKQTLQEHGKCHHCSNAAHSQIVNAALPPRLFANSLASPELVAALIQHKYQLSLPLDRQRKSLQAMGLTVKETSLANWVIKASETLAPLNS